MTAYLYDVYIWLSDQADWKLHAVVPGCSEADAINRARTDVTNAWPDLMERVESSPATARLRLVPWAASTDQTLPRHAPPANLPKPKRGRSAPKTTS